MEGGRILGMRWETTHPVVRIVSVYFECGYVVEARKLFTNVSIQRDDARFRHRVCRAAYIGGGAAAACSPGERVATTLH